MQHNVFEPLLYLTLLVIGGLVFALVRLINSDPHVAMRAMKRELEEAQRLLQEYRVKEQEWTAAMNKKALALDTAEDRLQEALVDVERLKSRLEQQDKTLDLQREVVARAEQRQKEYEKRFEWLLGRVMQLELLQNGKTPKFPWNE